MKKEDVIICEIPKSPNFKNLVTTPQTKYGKLTVIEFVGKENSSNPTLDAKYVYKCICECGKDVYIRGSHLTGGKTISCGCHRDKINFIHGDYKTPIYYSWQDMKDRCYNQNNIRYKNYGGRGIIVCDEWKNSYLNFKNDIGEKPTSEHTLDRIDVNGNYCKENCRWASLEEQANNTTRNHFVELDGINLTITQWARKYSLKPEVIFGRLERGWSEERAIKTPSNKKPLLTVIYMNKEMSLDEFSKLANLPTETMRFRIKNGWSPERAFSTPLKTKKRKNND